MFGASPFYRSYSPYLHSSYHQPQPQCYSPYYTQRPVDLDRARALAAQRARRAQWLPDEYDDDDDYQLGPDERAYLNAHRNQMLMERERERREQEEAEVRRRALEEQRWRQKEDEAARRRVDEERERRRQHHVSSPMSDVEQQMHAQSSAPRTVPPSTRTVEAASVLQRHFRTRQSIHSIKFLTSDFTTLRRNFTYPSTISFQKPSSPPASNDVINVSAISTHPDDTTNLEDASIPKLAFNSTNYDLHAYIEALDKLLVKLDGVESWGDADVRTRRRGVVKRIEEAQAFLERFWKTSWLKHIKEQSEWVDGDMPMGEEALVYGKPE